MMPFLLALALWSVGSPPGSAPKHNPAPPMQLMQGRALFDDEMAPSHISVRVSGEKIDQPATGISVSLFTAPKGPTTDATATRRRLRLTGRTDRRGRLVLQAEPHAGKQGQLEIACPSGLRRSQAFTIPPRVGVRFFFACNKKPPSPAAPGKSSPTKGPSNPVDQGRPRGTAPPTKAPLERRVSSMGMTYRVRSIEGGRVHLTLYYTVFYEEASPRSPKEAPKRALDGEAGVVLPLPHRFQGAHVMTAPRGVKLQSGGVFFPGTSTSLEHQAIVSGALSYEGTALQLSQDSPLPWRGFVVTTPRYEGVEVLGPGVEPVSQELMRRQDVHVYSGSPPSSSRGSPPMSFTLNGLPQRGRGWAWAVVGLTVALLLAGIWRRVLAQKEDDEETARGDKKHEHDDRKHEDGGKKEDDETGEWES